MSSNTIRGEVHILSWSPYDDIQRGRRPEGENFGWQLMTCTAPVICVGGIGYGALYVVRESGSICMQRDPTVCLLNTFE
jgi:hypothetical protein